MSSPTSPLTDAEPNRLQQEVVILGGGFAGVYCGQRIRKSLKKAGLPPEMALIVSDQNYMVFQPMLAEVAGGSLSPRHVVNPIRRLCKGIQVLRGQVERIDLEKKEVHINTGNFSAGVIVEFNHIMLGVGAEIDLSRVPGMPEHALLMQNVGDAMILRATIISRIEEANAEQREEVRKRLLTFVVVGGGYSGVETAGEILDLVKSVAKFYRYVSEEDLRVVLVHSRSRVLHTLGDELGDYAGKKLTERGLELILEDRVGAVTATKVCLQSEKIIDTATVISTVGTAPNRIIKQLCDEQGLPNHRYFIKTNEFMQVEGFENVWASGDCASIPLADSDGKYCPQTAQFAMREGICIADNIGAKIQGKPLKPFTFQGLGELASIGHQTAVASIMGIQFSGFIAWFMWRSIYLSKLPGLDRKLRVMIDWTLDLFFPRDINLLSPRYTKLFREVHLEPNDTLFRRGEPAFSLYVVQEGGIDLQDENGKVVREIEEGDFFGERALVHGGGYLYDAVAKDSTQLVSLSGEAVLPFFESSRRFRRVLAKTTAQGSAEGELAVVRKKLPDAILSASVSDVMRRDIATLRSDQTINEALTMFLSRRFSIYPLVTDDGKLTGVIAREDVFDFIKRDDIDDKTCLDRIDLMHLPICKIGDSVDVSLDKMMRAGRYKCLVVDDEQRLHGILTVMDLLGEAAKQQM
ncbi:FAD-dependent oxidoreductase [Verrucomicrobiales bacterium]|jgi:NADH:ubiquinone reductase (H+-translocating)|nr:FAD-dependent oxidoreductase [Verrucomicrobiales bacterium]